MKLIFIFLFIILNPKYFTFYLISYLKFLKKKTENKLTKIIYINNMKIITTKLNQKFGQKSVKLITSQ